MGTTRIDLSSVLEDTTFLLTKFPVKTPEGKILLKLQSDLKDLDNRLKVFFEQKQLKSLLAAYSRDPALAEKFQQEYKNIASDLLNNYEKLVLQCQPDNLSDRGRSELLKVGSKILLIARYIPDFNKYGSNTLIALAKSLGGAYMHIDQAELPLTGANYTEGKGYEEASGICAGMVIEWANQSAELGTPNYPIASNLDVLTLFNQQAEKKATLFSSDRAKPFKDLDMIEFLSNFEQKIPYYLRISDSVDPTGHAIGIRKHSNFIEIFDPNYGYIFFQNYNSASLWLNALMRDYEAMFFPNLMLTKLRYNVSANQINSSVFPTRKILDEASFIGQTGKAYGALLRKYNEHMSKLCDYAVHFNREIPFKLLKLAIQDMNSRLSAKDSELLIECLQKCGANLDYDEKYQTILTKRIFDSLKGQDLSDIHTRQVDIPDEIKLVENKIAERRNDLAKLINNYHDRLIDARRNNLGAEVISTLSVKEEILQARLKAFDKTNIVEKLLDVNSGETNRKYSILNALDELNQICPGKPQAFVEGEHIDQCVELVLAINKAMEVYKQLRESLRTNPDASNTLQDVLKNKTNEFITANFISKYEKKLAELKEEAISGGNIDSIKTRLNDVLPANMKNPVTELEALFKSKIKPKYTAAELRDLATLFDDTIMVVNLARDFTAQGNNNKQQEFAKLLTARSSNFKDLLIDVIDPQKEKLFEVSDLNPIFQALHPEKIKWVIEALAVPKQISDYLVDQILKNPSPQFHKIAKTILKLHAKLFDNKINIEEYFAAILKELHASKEKTPARFNFKQFVDLLKKEVAVREVNADKMQHRPNSVTERVNIIERDPKLRAKFSLNKLADAKPAGEPSQDDIRKFFEMQLDNRLAMPNRRHSIFIAPTTVDLEKFIEFKQEVLKLLDGYLSSATEVIKEAREALVRKVAAGKEEFKDNREMVRMLGNLEDKVVEFQSRTVSSAHHKPGKK